MAAAGMVGTIEVINQAKPKPLRTDKKATSDHSDQWSGNSSLQPVSERSTSAPGFALLGVRCSYRLTHSELVGEFLN